MRILTALFQWLYGLLMLAGLVVSILAIYTSGKQVWTVYPTFAPGDSATLTVVGAVAIWLMGRLWDWHEKRRTAGARVAIREMADDQGWITREEYQWLLKKYGATILEAAMEKVGAKIGPRKMAASSAVP